jgi:Mg2+ and Co2+ transporter CorA
MLRAVLFGPDEGRTVDDWQERRKRLGENELLWVDLTEPADEDLKALATAFELSAESVQRLRELEHEPELVETDDRYHLSVLAADASDGDLQLFELECAFAEGWIVTAHARPVGVLDEFRERAEGGGEFGRLDAPSFVAAMVEWVVAGYLRVYERMEAQLEEFDIAAMTGRGEPSAALNRLVALRSANGNLRRAIAPHREVFAALTHPEFDLLSSSESAERFSALVAQLDRALDASRDVREAVRGSFDILIARSGHRTNEIMKVLTLASVLLLPGALLAGVMGMNFQVGLFDHAWVFWGVIAVILGTAVLTLVAGRLRGWI